MVMQKFQPSKLQAAVMVFQLQFIDTFVHVPEITQRQVPMIQKVQKDQKTGDAQVSSEVYVDRTKDSQNDIRKRQECSACRRPSTALGQRTCSQRPPSHRHLPLQGFNGRSRSAAQQNLEAARTQAALNEDELVSAVKKKMKNAEWRLALSDAAALSSRSTSSRRHPEAVLKSWKRSGSRPTRLLIPIQRKKRRPRRSTRNRMPSTSTRLHAQNQQKRAALLMQTTSRRRQMCPELVKLQ